MYKIAIIGCENSHAQGFLKVIQQSYPDMQVLGVHSEYPGEAEKLHQMVGEVFGYQPKAVRACRNGNQVSCLIRYENFDVSAQYHDNSHVYYAAVNFPKELAAPDMDLSGATGLEFAEFYKLLTGGEMEQSYEDLFGPVFMFNAIARALESGREEPVNRL